MLDPYGIPLRVRAPRAEKNKRRGSSRRVKPRLELFRRTMTLVSSSFYRYVINHTEDASFLHDNEGSPRLMHRDPSDSVTSVKTPGKFVSLSGFRGAEVCMRAHAAGLRKRHFRPRRSDCDKKRSLPVRKSHCDRKVAS